MKPMKGQQKNQRKNQKEVKDGEEKMKRRNKLKPIIKMNQRKKKKEVKDGEVAKHLEIHLLQLLFKYFILFHHPYHLLI